MPELFSITAAPKLTITSPNGGEVWRAGTMQSILWNSTNVDSVKIEYSLNNGVTWQAIVNAVPSTGLYVWQVPMESSYQCRVKISDRTNKEIYDESDNPFTIAILDLLKPIDGETLLSGSPYNIVWNSASIVNLKIEFSANDGNSWTTVAQNVNALIGSYAWTLPSGNIQQGRIKISDMTKSAVYDMNESSFAVKQIIVIAPIDNSTFKVGETQIIQWKTYNIANVKLEYSTDSGTTWNKINDNVPSSVGYYYWIVPDSPSEFCSVKISDASNLSTYATNGNFFSIKDIPTSVAVNESKPVKYDLLQNYPNPFNPTTEIQYQIPIDGFVTLKIYNLLGEEIGTLVNKEMNAGFYRVIFDGSSLPSGVYIYKIQAGNFTSAKKLMLVK